MTINFLSTGGATRIIAGLSTVAYRVFDEVRRIGTDRLLIRAGTWSLNISISSDTIIINNKTFSGTLTQLDNRLRPVLMPGAIVKDRKWVIEHEGDPWDTGGTTWASGKAAVTAGAAVSAVSGTVPYGFFANIKGLRINADAPCLVQGVIRKGIYSSIFPKSLVNINEVFGTGGGNAFYDFGEDGMDMSEGGAIALTVYATTTTPINLSWGFIKPKLITLDSNYSGSVTYLACGDSKVWSGMGNIGAGTSPNLGSSLYAMRATAAWRATGADVRLLNKAFGGSGALAYAQLAQSDEWRNLDWSSIQLITQDVMANDASTGTAAATNFTANYQIFLDYVFSKNPNISFIALGAPPITETTRSTNIAGYRSALSSYITTQAGAGGRYAGKDLRYLDLSTAWATPTGANDAHYNETTLATYLHPRGDTGHSDIHNLLWPQIQLTNAFLNF
jgi:hypothetical protein